MSISPFSAHPLEPDGERRRARLVVLLVALGIAASLVAYAVSPSVRHAVGHAAHSVRRAVSHVFDRDARPHARGPAPRSPLTPAHAPAGKAPSGSVPAETSHPAAGTSTGRAARTRLSAA